MDRVIFHIDVNNAFLSWEAVNRIKNGEKDDIRLVPSAVCGDPENRHGIILAKSMPAKKMGVKTGEPISSALSKCPELLCVPPNFAVYSQYSKALFKILSDYSDRIEAFSIDEGFLDYTGMENLFGDYMTAAKNIKKRIYDELGFTVNIGISSNKILAKMAGDLEKPDKIITLFPDEIETKMWPLPVQDLFMVGNKTVAKLNQLGIYTIGDLAKYDVKYLVPHFKSYSYILNSYANGKDDSPVGRNTDDNEPKSISSSVTTPKDVCDKETAQLVFLSLAEKISSRLRKSNLKALEVAVILKTSEFKSTTHQKQLSSPIDCTNAIFNAALELFESNWKQQPLRLIGIRVGNLCDENTLQLSLYNEKNWDKWHNLDSAIDAIRNKYGKDSIVRSSLLNKNLSPQIEKLNGSESLKNNNDSIKTD